MMILGGTDPRVRRKRTRKGGGKNGTAAGGSREMMSAGIVLGLTIIYVLFLVQTERALNSVALTSLTSSNTTAPSLAFRLRSLLGPATLLSPPQQQLANVKNVPLPTAEGKMEKGEHLASDGDDRFLFFSGIFGGQGTGNIVSGLLAAHLLGEEFNRTVCVLPNYQAFLSVFDPIQNVEKCARVLPNHSGNSPLSFYQEQHGEDHIQLINFIAPPDECALQEKLSSRVRILYLMGNTYPRWPSVPDRYFFQHYRPKPVLLEALPYKVPPTTVVHLREPDSAQTDYRSGLDSASLRALQDLLPKGPSTYLVTNRVAYYEQFATCCQWSHPQWHTVVHSALGRQWGALDTTTANDTNKEEGQREVDQNLQMWADWYTLLTAETVYHTHSDFSISAVHWMNNLRSHSIVGYNATSHALETRAESWIIDGETAPLAQRRRNAVGTSQLRLCGTEHGRRRRNL